jgi:hypothetical protein
MMQADEEDKSVPQETPGQLQNTNSEQKVEEQPGENGSKEHSAEKNDGKDKKDKKKAKSDSAAKLAFLEKKYKEVFTENNARKDEIIKLVRLVQDFLKEIDVDVKSQENYEIGDVVAYRTAFVDGWVRFRKKNEVERRRSEEEFKNREKSLQEELMKEKTESQNKKEQGVKEAKFAADKVIRNLEELNSKLQTDSSNFLQLLKVKEAEIAEVREANLALSNKATDSLMVRFEKIGQNDMDSKIEQSSRVDEIIRLRNDLDEAHETIDNLEAQLIALQKRKQSDDNLGSKDKVETKKVVAGGCKRSDIGVQTDEDDLRPSFISPNRLFSHVSPSPGGQSYQRFEEKLEKEALLRKDDEEESSKGYLKSLVVRYLIFEAKKNDSECNVLRRAILDCLKIGSEERATIDDAINNRGGLKDSVYFLRIFGGST